MIFFLNIILFVLAASGVVATLFHDGLMNPCEGILLLSKKIVLRLRQFQRKPFRFVFHEYITLTDKEISKNLYKSTSNFLSVLFLFVFL